MKGETGGPGDRFPAAARGNHRGPRPARYRQCAVENPDHGRAVHQLRPQLADLPVVRGRKRRSDRDPGAALGFVGRAPVQRSEEHTSELQSLMRISYAVFCLKKKNTAMMK